jgi:hypothetical protein
MDERKAIASMTTKSPYLKEIIDAAAYRSKEVRM